MADEPTRPDPEGLSRAREVAQWELGDPSWAEKIVGAYLDPEHYAVAEARAGLYEDAE